MRLKTRSTGSTQILSFFTGSSSIILYVYSTRSLTKYMTVSKQVCTQIIAKVHNLDTKYPRIYQTTLLQQYHLRNKFKPGDTSKFSSSQQNTSV